MMLESKTQCKPRLSKMVVRFMLRPVYAFLFNYDL